MACDELVAERVLEGRLLDALEAVGVAGDLDDLFVLDVADLDLADALGQPEHLELGERLDGVHFAVLVHDRRVVALLDGRPDAEAEADALGAGDLEVAAVADADLVDLVEQVVGRVTGEVVGHAGLDAEVARAMYLPIFSNSGLSAYSSSPSFLPHLCMGSVGCGSLNVMAVSR